MKSEKKSLNQNNLSQLFSIVNFNVKYENKIKNNNYEFLL